MLCVDLIFIFFFSQLFFSYTECLSVFIHLFIFSVDVLQNSVICKESTYIEQTGLSYDKSKRSNKSLSASKKRIHNPASCYHFSGLYRKCSTAVCTSQSKYAISTVYTLEQPMIECQVISTKLKRKGETTQFEVFLRCFRCF